MASSPVIPLFNGQLGNAAAALYTSPAGTWTQLTKLLLVNTDTVTRSVTFNLVPSGGSAITANITTKAQAVRSGQSWNSPNEYGLILAPGDALYGFADSATEVNAFLEGVSVTG